jgi:hypothetical protein
MKIRCKMLVNGIERGMGSKQVIDPATGKSSWVPCEQRTIKLHPVYGNGDPNHENTKFWAATPSGQFHFTMISLETAEVFELNKEYYVDITPAD